jgi:hypothetical protein
MGVRIGLIDVRIFITESALVAALIVTIILELASTLKRLDRNHERKVHCCMHWPLSVPTEHCTA